MKIILLTIPTLCTELASISHLVCAACDHFNSLYCVWQGRIYFACTGVPVKSKVIIVEKVSEI